MKFTNLMQNFITFLDKKEFNYTINNKNLYDKNKEKNNETIQFWKSQTAN